MHPLVRDLYKRAMYVGRDYPMGIDYVRIQWKKALRNPDNCPSVVMLGLLCGLPVLCERELRKVKGQQYMFVK